MYRRKITDILQTIVDAMEFPVVIYSVVQSPPGTYLLSVDNIYYAQTGFTVTIGGNKYTIADFDDTECEMTLTVTGSADITVSCFDMDTPSFFYGTPKGEAGETVALINQNGVNSVFPFIWLWNTPEKLNEVFTLDPDDDIERVSTMSLFFLTRSVSDDKRPPALVENYVGPMDRLKQNFVKALENPFSGIYKWGQNEKSKSYQSLGITLTQKEGGKALFPGEMAGIEMNISLSIYRDDGGGCC